MDILCALSLGVHTFLHDSTSSVVCYRSIKNIANKCYNITETLKIAILLLTTYLVKIFVVSTHVVHAASHFAFLRCAYKRFYLRRIFSKSKKSILFSQYQNNGILELFDNYEVCNTLLEGSLL